jgi:hypothetical protein
MAKSNFPFLYFRLNLFKALKKVLNALSMKELTALWTKIVLHSGTTVQPTFYPTIYSGYCKYFWVNAIMTLKNCFLKFVNTGSAITGANAETACVAKGAHLASVHSAHENRFIFGKFKRNKKTEKMCINTFDERLSVKSNVFRRIIVIIIFQSMYRCFLRYPPQVRDFMPVTSVSSRQIFPQFLSSGPMTLHSTTQCGVQVGTISCQVDAPYLYA